ncbi:MAG: hypothetical protein NTX50_21995 [Candidatus Sumerlaeota bacterium]|nr:hypothetical protein [Candidatus Sumerlaeota bacterium]
MIYTLSIEPIYSSQYFKKCVRVIEIAEEAMLEDLHYFIQKTFRFDNDHMHEFFAGRDWRHQTIRFEGEEIEPFYDQFKEFVTIARQAGGDIEKLLSLVSQSPTLGKEVADEISAPAKKGGKKSDPTDESASAGNDESKEKKKEDLDEDEGGEEDEDGDDEEGDWDDEEGSDYGDYPLNRVFPLPSRMKLYYHFDFGDDWYFEIRKQGNPKEPHPRAKYPRVIEKIGPTPKQYPRSEW